LFRTKQWDWRIEELREEECEENETCLAPRWQHVRFMAVVHFGGACQGNAAPDRSARPTDPFDSLRSLRVVPSEHRESRDEARLRSVQWLARPKPLARGTPWPLAIRHVRLAACLPPVKIALTFLSGDVSLFRQNLREAKKRNVPDSFAIIADLLLQVPV
jgi:hypothetical protein